MDFDSNWSVKSPYQWSSNEVTEWLCNWASQNGVDVLDVMPHLVCSGIQGSDLCRMTRDDLVSMCPQLGNCIYDSLQQLIHSYRHSSLTNCSTDQLFGLVNGNVNGTSIPEFAFPSLTANFDLLSQNMCLDLDSQTGNSPSASTTSGKLIQLFIRTIN